MISFEEALRLILDETPVMHTKRVKLERLLGRVLAEPVVTPTDLPSFDNSAVDGFGIKLNDISAASQSHPRKLPLSATIQAGDSGDSELIAGNAFKILTGAPVPPSVEAVVMREYCREEYGSVIVETSAKEGENIRRRGAEFLRGQQILPTASLATPPVIGMLATLGYPSFPVYEQPSVAIMYTGNELIRPGKPLAHGQIYNSNSYALTAALESFGCTDLKVFHAKDTPASTKRALKSALSFADVIISTGGVSVGDYDYVKDIAEQMCIKTIFWKIALKPGKPVYFGVSTNPKNKKLIFGLPGNPVSALVTYHQLVKPALSKMTGRTPSPFITHAILTKSLHKRPGRMEFVRATAHDTDGNLQVTPLTGQDSHMMGGLAQANCLIHFPLEAEHIEAGTPAKIEFLSWQS